MKDDSVSGNMPDAFDLTVGNLVGLPDSLRTSQATIHTTTPVVGKAETWIIQTIRRRDKGEDTNDKGGKVKANPSLDTILLQRISGDGALRIALPPKVADVIARQYDALSSRARSKGARERAARDKAAGKVPGFMRGGKRKRGKRKKA